MFKRIVSVSFTIFLVSCGTDVQVKAPSPSANPVATEPVPSGDGAGKTTYAKMQAHLVTYCQQCHSNANFMQSERGLAGSSVKSRITDRSMPPSNANKAMPDNVRTEMLNFF